MTSQPPRHRRSAITTGLKTAGAAVAGITAATGPFIRRARAGSALPGLQAGASAQAFNGYGPLIPDWRPRPIVDLPEGFEYRVLIERGDSLSNGQPRPSQADGMVAFELARGRTLLVMNHENTYRSAANITPVELADAYDPEAAGGTSALIVTPDLRVEYSFATSAGTVRNCAGGGTPWGTWLTCEETEHVPGLPEVPATLRHGYTFEVLPFAAPDAQPMQIRLPGLGRFNKEAAVVDPATGIAYLTEDHAEGLLYRFVPAGYRPTGFGDYLKGGRLQALRIEQVANTTTAFPGRRPFRVGWVDIDDPDALERPTRIQGVAKGATIFSRGEGTHFQGGALYFTATSGGESGGGQIWRFVPATGMIELFFESTDRNDLEGPDNITMHPTSGDVYVCEDGAGTDFIRMVTPEGRSFPVARIAMPVDDPRQKGLSGITDTAGEVMGSPPDGRIDNEDAGICFSPDGQVMFFNIQAPSMTIAVWGPFRQGVAAGGSGRGVRAMALADPPPGWLPGLSDTTLGRGTLMGYRPTEIAALQALGIDI